jgi:hypothetical protein
MYTADSSSHSCKQVEALERLDDWIEQEEFRGWDPHDALNSVLLRRLTLRSRVLGILWLQLLKRSPFNFRPLLGVAKDYNPKAMGLFMASYAQKFLSTRQPGHLEQVRFFSDWLIRHATPGYAGPCWGYNFDWPNRSFFAPAGTPTIVNTAFIALSFLSAEPALKCLANLARTDKQEAARGERKALGLQDVDVLSIARGACEFILQDLNVLRPSPDEMCFSYTPLDRRFVHNANLLGGWLLSAIYARTGEINLAESARAAAHFTALRQKADGSWSYGISKADQWTDNFHTGFVLVALKRIAQYLQTVEFDSVTSKGYQFWKERMFIAGQVPKYYPEEAHPIDIHCVAQAILTFLEFSDIDPGALKQADQVSQWAIENLQDSEGFFHYQIRRGYHVRIPYMRWGQAWMQLALTRLIHTSTMESWVNVAQASRCDT